MHQFVYPATLRRDAAEGGYVVTFNDFPEAITHGDDLADALVQAADCLEEAIAGRIRRGDDIPSPSRATKRGHSVPVPAPMAAKAALYLAMKHSPISKVELAKRLGCDEKEVRRLLDPRHSSELSRIEKALEALGQRLAVGVRAA